jgi:hypothetical protein
MYIDQISIFLENRAGRILDITEIFGENNINIRALSLADTSDFGILRMIVDDVKRAMDVLKNKGFIVKQSKVVAVEVPDRPGGLASVLRVLAEKQINVEYMYAFFEQPKDKALLIFRFEDTETAVQVLEKHGITVLRKQAIGVR